MLKKNLICDLGGCCLFQRVSVTGPAINIFMLRGFKQQKHIPELRNLKSIAVKEKEIDKIHEALMGEPQINTETAQTSTCLVTFFFLRICKQMSALEKIKGNKT